MHQQSTPQDKPHNKVCLSGHSICFGCLVYSEPSIELTSVFVCDQIVKKSSKGKKKQQVDLTIFEDASDALWRRAGYFN